MGKFSSPEAPSVYHCCFHLTTFRFLEVPRSTVEPTNFLQNNRKPGPKKISFEKTSEKTHIPWKPNITSPETSHFLSRLCFCFLFPFWWAQKGWFPGSCTTQTNHPRGPIPSNAKPFSRSAGFKRRPVDTMEGGLDDGLNPKKCLKNLNRHQPLRTIKDKGRVFVFAVVFFYRDPKNTNYSCFKIFIYIYIYMHIFISNQMNSERMMHNMSHAVAKPVFFRHIFANSPTPVGSCEYADVKVYVNR